MIGNFVSRQTRGLRQFLRCLIQSRRKILIRDFDRAIPVKQRKGRFRLNGQLIQRQMIGAEGQRLASILRATGIRLAGPGINQIQRHPIEISQRQRQRGFGFCGIVQPAQRFQVGVIQGLHPQRQAIDAGGFVIRERAPHRRWRDWLPG